MKMKEAGSIAEASLRINKIFEVAQQAADEYLKSIKEVNKPSHECAQINENPTKDEADSETNASSCADWFKESLTTSLKLYEYVSLKSVVNVTLVVLSILP